MENQALIEEQKKLEEEMRGVTVKRYHSLHDKAADRGEFSTTHAGKKLLAHVLQPFENAIHAWVAEVEAGVAGRKPAAIRLVKDLNDIPTLAFLFTKGILNHVPMLETKNEKASRTRVIMLTTETIHDELRLRWFAEHSGALLKKMLKDFDKRDVNRDRRRQLIQRTFNQRKLQWVAEGWTQSNRIHLGMKLLELFRDSTGLIELVEIREHSKRKAIVKSTPELVETLANRMEACENLFTVYYPMVVPPVKWSATNMIGGGYLTNNVTPYKMVKHASFNYLNDLSNVDIEPTLQSLNAVQETPFRVNKTMVDILEWAYEQNRGIGGLPIASDREIPPVPHNIDEDEEVLKDYRKACYKVHDLNRREISSRGAILRTISLARKFGEYENIYFPNDLDSRGRMYPKPTYLNPQGTGYVKSLLEFGKAKPIYEEDAAFLAITGANAYGEDKVSLQARVDWVFANEEMILDIAEDPKADQRWTEADSPFEFLRFCLEWKGLVDHGFGFMSTMPCPVDATCSGLQHFSAMLRDKIGGRAVNLCDLETRQDIYQEVADLCVTTVTKDLNNTKLFGSEPKEGHEDQRVPTNILAQVALDLGITRKLTKRPVMIVPYSGTFSACMKYTEDFYNEMFEGGVVCPMDEKLFVRFFISYISKHIWQNIDSTVVAARETMTWMKKLATLSCKGEDQAPIQWTTPTGFVVQQAKYKSNQKIVYTFLDGSQTKISVREDTNELDPKKNSSSLSPNFIHSMDAAHLQLTVCKAVNSGNDMSFAMVHDSFGVHASDMKVFQDECIAPAFYEMYQQGDNLNVFLQQISNNIPKSTEIPEIPAMGELDLEDVLYSDFFFS